MTNILQEYHVRMYFLPIGCRGADRCYNRSLCEEHLNLILPSKPPFHPRQFQMCAVVGNSGDLLKTEFGEEIDRHDAVIRDNEAPVNEVNVTACAGLLFSSMQQFIFEYFCEIELIGVFGLIQLVLAWQNGKSHSTSQAFPCDTRTHTYII